MFGVWFVGPTDSFLNALFQDEDEATEWALWKGRENHDNDGGFYIVFYRLPQDVPVYGWEG